MEDRTKRGAGGPSCAVHECELRLYEPIICVKKMLVSNGGPTILSKRERKKDKLSYRETMKKMQIPFDVWMYYDLCSSKEMKRKTLYESCKQGNNSAIINHILMNHKNIRDTGENFANIFTETKIRKTGN